MSRALAVLLAPIVAVQGRRLSRVVPRLPEAGGPRTGSVPGPHPLRLVVIGDSTAVGTGVTRLEQGIPGALARRLSHGAGGRGVEWRAIGRSGATSAEVLAAFGDEAASASADLAVVLVGWNDALRLRSRRAFGRDLRALLERIRQGSPDAGIVVVAPPRFGRFAVLPQPLRTALGRHATGLARVAAGVAHDTGAGAAPGFDGRSVAADGFHPDAAGYETLAAGIARAAPGVRGKDPDADRARR